MRRKNAPPIKVAIADNHAIVREGLRQICAGTNDISVVFDTQSDIEAILRCQLDNCDVLLLDIALADHNGIDMLKQIKRKAPSLPLLVLSMYREDQYAVRCLRAGAAGFLNKQVSPMELTDAIRQVAVGKKYISPSLAEELATHIGTDHDTPLHESLSNREYQIMTLIASGKSVSDIATDLFLSVKTISMFRARALNKMRLRNNAELTHYALTHHLVDMSE